MGRGHVSATSTFTKISELKNKRIAKSRFGSGSHLMAFANAYNQGWNINMLKFIVVKNLEGSINAIQNNEADYFLWEHFTTKPVVDKNVFRRVGNCPTPWPYFVIAVRNEILEKHPEEIAKIVVIINQTTTNFKSIKNVDKILSKRYHQKLEDIQEWLSITDWNCGELIEKEFISSIQNKLLLYNVINKKKNPEDFI